MKKRFSILIISSVIIGLTLSLFGMALVSQTASAERAQNSYRQPPKPISAANVKVVKKIPLSLDMEETKGKPDGPPGKDKDNDSSNGAATGILGEPLSEGASKYAIVIGICDYPGDANDLCASDGDSLNMYKALTEFYGYADENIYLLRDTYPITDNMPTDGPATFNEIEDAILNQIKPNAGPKDEVVFFFSGHGGWPLDENDNPIDVYPYDEADGRDELIVVHDGDKTVGISDDMLVGWFSDFATTRIIFIFDTCLAGGMNDLADEKSSENGRVVVMSTEENRSAYVYSTGGSDIDGDGIEDGEGVFSRLFVNKGMLQGLADGYNQLKITDEKVVVEEAFDYAKKNIPGFLKRKQKPVISDNFDDDLLL